MIIRVFISAILAFAVNACSDDNQDSTFEQDTARLEAALEEITEFAASVPCTDAEEWEIAPYGAKPCGGPWGYLAYSVKIDGARLQNMLDEYYASNQALNEKWGLGSDCAIARMPLGVHCEGGKPVIVYE